MPQFKYEVEKHIDHSEGLSCVFRQWRAPETHCSFLHGYPLAFTFTFGSDTLDQRNWVISFGELKEVKQFLKDMFDHTVIVAVDDPLLISYYEMQRVGLVQLQVLPDVGCEKVAEFVYANVVQMLQEKLDKNNVKLISVRVAEHTGNSATFYG